MKYLLHRYILILSILTGSFLFPQKSAVVKTLNIYLKKDLELQSKSNRFEDTLKVITAYRPHNGILSIETETNGVFHYIEKQEVHLSDITGVAKDINVVFTTQQDAVKTTRHYIGKNKDIPGYEGTGSMFFTGIRQALKNEYLGKALLKAFAQDGYSIRILHWYD
ncbi:hypothetical protein [Chryseobacterium indologenes]|uniref:Uncharacterized protein n=1 Tax=Chryseobacterium indologenes TaxID=253 RepID=A0A0N0ZUW4_CHRID|nr:hypothetical protein [Chryseobacterium indologenes]KPE49517.1 hypothetical protein AOB46_19405 [Chryseobacterium indologenes]